MKPLTFGVRAHDLGTMSADELGNSVLAHGFQHIQLAPGKALTGVPICPGMLTESVLRDIETGILAKGIRIPVLGCYIHPLHPDDFVLEQEIIRFEEHIVAAKRLGAAVVGTETGTVLPDQGYHPDTHGEAAFQRLARTLFRLVSKAEEVGQDIAVEGVWKHTLNTPERIHRLVQLIGSRRLKVIYDPVNLMYAGNLDRQTEVMDEMFDLLSDRFCAFHIKDFVPCGDPNLVDEADIGKGQMNYSHLLRLIRTRTPDLPLLFEGLKPHLAEESRNHLSQA